MSLLQCTRVSKGAPSLVITCSSLPPTLNEFFCRSPQQTDNPTSTVGELKLYICSNEFQVGMGRMEGGGDVLITIISTFCSNAIDVTYLVCFPPETQDNAARRKWYIFLYVYPTLWNYFLSCPIVCF